MTTHRGRQTRPTFVYFIRPLGKDGPIKIGCSGFPDDRLLALAKWSPIPLELIGKTPGTFQDERYLHNCFADSHSHKEWFRFSRALAETIDKILKSSIDEVRPTLQQKQSIRSRKAKASPMPLSERQRRSFMCRIRAAQKRVHGENPSGGWRTPADVSLIMDRWHGDPYRKAAGAHPSDAELVLVEEYLRNPAARPASPRLAS